MAFINLETQGAVAVLTIDRPKALNALNSAVLEELDAAIDSWTWARCAAWSSPAPVSAASWPVRTSVR